MTPGESDIARAQRKTLGALRNELVAQKRASILAKKESERRVQYALGVVLGLLLVVVWLMLR